MGHMITPEPYTTKAGDTRWKVRFRLGGTATSRTFADNRGAATFARLVHQLGPEGAVKVLTERLTAAAGGDVPTLADYAGQHVDALTGVQDDTRARYRGYVRRDLGTLAHLPVTAISDRAVGRWVAGLEKAGQSGKTIKNKHGFLSAVMERAVRDGLVPSNPCKGTRLPRTVREAMTFLTHDEYARFLGFFVPHWQPLVVTLFSTGLRWGEATALRVGDVDLHQHTATVVQAWKDDGTLGPPKSERSRRTITLAPETVAVLRPLVDGRPGDALVFTNRQGRRVRGQTFHDSAWQPAVRLANGEPAETGKRASRRRDAEGERIVPAKVPLGKRPRVHDARHSCASWLLGAGVPVNYVQAHLGHESVTTTVGTYGHIMPAARQAVSGALSLALSQAHPQIEA